MSPSESAVSPVVIGLLGGIASGKSTVARMFKESGFEVIDADRLAREAVREPRAQARIRARFGPEVFAADGELHREKVAEIVFADADARRDLEAILHPAVRLAIADRLMAALQAGRSVVLDVPLLLENGLIELCDECVFLDCAEEVRRDRAAQRGWDAAELGRREAAQAPLADKRARCRFTVRTDGAVDAARAQVDSIVAQLARA